MQNNIQDKREFGLSSLAVNNRTTVFLLMIMLAVMGVVAYISMPKETFPEIVQPQVYVGVPYPGNSPVDMENLIARPIEKEIKTIKGLKKVTSTNVSDYSTIVAEFNTDADIDKAVQEVKDAVDRAKADLPNDLPVEPNVFELDLSNMPIMFVNISGDYSADELKEYAEYLKDEIEGLSEISKCDIKGLTDKEVEISVDLASMQALKISFYDIEQAIANENVTLSGGALLEDGYRKAVRVAGEFESVEEIENLIVKHERQRVVRLGDIADVSFGEKEIESYARLDGLPVVTLDVVKKTGENVIEAAYNVKDIIADAQKTRFPEDLSISISNDQSKQTESQVANMENSIISGVILVVLVLMFFLGLRNSLFVGLSIPLSMMIGFLVLGFLGISLNMIVLFAMILALGMLVDNAIVVVENTYRYTQEGYSLSDAAKIGAGEVAWPIIASTATTVAAFLPLAFWTGIIGEFMKYLPITLVIVLTSSLFVALVINPMLTSKFMKQQDEFKKKRMWILTIVFGLLGGLGYLLGISVLGNLGVIIVAVILLDGFILRPGANKFQNNLLPRLENFYEGIVDKALTGSRPRWYLVGTLGLLVFSFVLIIVKAPQQELFPGGDPQYVNVFIELPNGTDIEETNKLTEELEGRIAKQVEPYQSIIESTVASVGAGTSDPNEGPSNANTPHKAKITIAFIDYNLRNGISSLEVMNEVRNAVAGTPGATITVAPNPTGPPTGKAINIEIKGKELDTLLNLRDKLYNAIAEEGIRGIEELKADVQLSNPELNINVDRAAARRYGLSTIRIAGEIRTALFGKEASEFKEGEEKYPINIRLSNEYRYSEQNLLNQPITFRDPATGKIAQVPISSVVDAKNGITYNAVKRIDEARVLTMSSNVEDGYNGTEIVGQIASVLPNIELPEGYTIEFTGEQQEQMESMAFLAKAMAVAVFLIFLIIVAQFNSIVTPFVIILSVLFSTIGVLLGIVLTNSTFVVIMTGIGIISLAGVVVNNAIVLIDYANLKVSEYKDKFNLDRKTALPQFVMQPILVEVGKTRLRPVLLTAITTVLGLIPLAIGLNIDFVGIVQSFDPDIYYGGDNASFWGPMAWTVIYGLVFATFLTLVIVPVMLLIIEKIKFRIQSAKGFEQEFESYH